MSENEWLYKALESSQPKVQKAAQIFQAGLKPLEPFCDNPTCEFNVRRVTSSVSKLYSLDDVVLRHAWRAPTGRVMLCDCCSKAVEMIMEKE